MCNMKLTSKAYWIVVFVGIVANIFIYSFLSRNLGEYAYNKALEEMTSDSFDISGQ